MDDLKLKISFSEPKEAKNCEPEDLVREDIYFAGPLRYGHIRPFCDLPVGTIFTVEHDDLRYVKIQEISCPIGGVVNSVRLDGKLCEIYQYESTCIVWLP